jgi:hypothetical protein
MVEVPEDLPGDSPDSGEKVPTATLIARMAAQIEAQQEQLAVKDRQLESKDRQIEQLHVLLQQAQAALPAPKVDQHSWWYKLWHRNGRWSKNVLQRHITAAFSPIRNKVIEYKKNLL